MVEENATTLIRGLKSRFGVESDEALASQIGVAKSTIATWRRRGTLPPKAIKELEARFGYTAQDLEQNGENTLREYILRQAFYFLVVGIVIGSAAKEAGAFNEAIIADDLALIDPYLKRSITRAASRSNYLGAYGATTFLLDLRAGHISGAEIVREAMAERKEAVTEQG